MDCFSNPSHSDCMSAIACAMRDKFVAWAEHRLGPDMATLCASNNVVNVMSQFGTGCPRPRTEVWEAYTIYILCFNFWADLKNKNWLLVCP